MDPTDFAFPVRRSRSYSALIRKDYELCVGVEQLRRLYTPSRLDSGVFFQAPKEEAGALEKLFGFQGFGTRLRCLLHVIEVRDSRVV